MSVSVSVAGPNPAAPILPKIIGGAAILFQVASLATISDPTSIALVGLAVVLVAASMVVYEQQSSMNGRFESGGDRQHPQDAAMEKRIGDAVAGTLQIVQASLDHNVRQQSLIDRTTNLLGKSDADVHLLLQENAEIKAEVRTLEVRLRDVYQEASRLRSELEHTRSETFTDGLTKLKNRKWFDTRLAEEIAKAQASGRPLTLALADLDKFKSINDTYGHVTGDRILQWAAERLTQNVKGRDSAARYGGEEFAIILPQTKLTDAVALLEQIRSQFEAVEWTHARTGRNMGRVTASFGAAQLRPGEGPEDLIERADKNLYGAKSAGRNQVVAR